MTPHFRVVVVLAAAAVLLSASDYALAAGGAGDPAAAAKLEAGKRLYRKYCGQCHALREARAVGFGSNKKKGFGKEGGPSFNKLRVPYNLSVQAVSVPWVGHEVLFRTMTWTQVKGVAAYIATVTKDHPALAQPIDG